EENKLVTGVTPQASQLLERFNWPGNVRQLENTVFRAVVLCDGAELDVCDFPQIAAAMGMDANLRQSAPSPAGESAAARPAASPYGLNVTDAAGNIRKFVE